VSTIKKGILRASSEWAKHLRPWGRRKFWHQHRQAEQEYIVEEQRMHVDEKTLRDMRARFAEGEKQ
jgi:hypothetical protein